MGSEMCIRDRDNHLYTGKLEFKPNEITTEEFDPQWIAEQYAWFRRQLNKIRIIKSLKSPRELRRSFEIFFDKLNDKMALHRIN